MSEATTTQESTRQALLEIQRYLADEIPPLMAVESARVLLRLPAKYGAAVIQQWIEAQLTAPDRAVTLSSYLYHAVKKVHLFAELKLVEQAQMDRYLSELSRLVVQLVPERERADLRLRLSRIGEVETALSAPVHLLNREKGTEEEEKELEETRQREEREAAEAAERHAISPRVAVFLERLEELQASIGEKPREAESQEVLARLLANAAVESQDPAQLEGVLRGLRSLGVEPKIDRKLFGLLGARLPGWELSTDATKPGVDEALGHLLKAMHRMVALADTREEGVERFSEMVYAAVDQFNEGHLAQAVAMLDVAERLVEEKKVDATFAKLVRERAQSSVSLGPLRQFASSPAKHGLLRKVLRFFPAFHAGSLLERLDHEPRRETRRLLLAIVEVHGPPCRPKLLERMGAYRTGKLKDPNGYFRRNIIYLMRRIPRGIDEDQRRELEFLEECSRPTAPFILAKEAIAALALLNLPKAERVLAEHLAAFEQEALGGTSRYAAEELMEILDRTCAALARVGSRDAVRRVVHHALRQEPQLGCALERIENLASCDLSRDVDQLEQLVDAVRKMLPSKLLGLVLGSRGREVSHLVRALSGTPSPSVERLFEEIVSRFRGQEFAEVAVECLTKFRSKAVAETPTATGLSGDLELFGLPTLLQSLSGAEGSGRLVLCEPNGSERGCVVLARGKIVGCEVGSLRGIDAVCQLFERPRPGSFRFERHSEEGSPRGSVAPMEVLPAILEAIRRHDEFQEDRALVPDGTSLMSTGKEMSLPPDEEDVAFVRAVWREAARGTAPESCEGTSGGDAFRVRRLYTYWLETGALKRRPEA